MCTEDHPHHPHHHHDHHHQDGDHQHSHEKVIEIKKDILSANQCMAERNLCYFDAKNIFTVNMVSSPGSGKTTILEQTIDRLKEKVSITVIEGDQQTTNDADRIKSTGVPAVQINTQNGCHLEANMIHKTAKDLSTK